MTFRAAFYKGTRPGIAGIYNRLVRFWTRSGYSHCELVFSDGMAASSSYMDHGVRFSRIEFDDAKWDFVELPSHLELSARAWFEAHKGERYDLRGNLHFIIGPMKDVKAAWFCSESLAAALGMLDPWRYDPGVLASALRAYSVPNTWLTQQWQGV